jgi:excisionase family DNA binding protein
MSKQAQNRRGWGLALMALTLVIMLAHVAIFTLERTWTACFQYLMIAAYLSPPAVARLLGISPDKVRNWCASGELKAANLAENQSGQRCRYRISPEALEAFLKRRSTPPQKQQRPRPRKPQPSVTEYY